MLVPYILLIVLGNLLLRKNKQPVLKSLFIMSFWGLLFAIVIFGINFLIVNDTFANVTFGVICLMGLRSLCGAACAFCWLKTLKNIPVSIADPLFNARMFPLLFIGWLVFTDPVTTVALVLTVVVFVSCFALAVFSKQNDETNKSANYFRGILWLALCLCLSLPIVMVARHMGDLGVDTILFTVISIFFMFVLITIAVFAAKLNPFKILKELWNDKLLIVASIPDNFWVLFYIPLALSMNMGLLDAILLSASALTVLAGVVILKEKVRLFSYLLIAVILGCAVAISLVAT